MKDGILHVEGTPGNALASYLDGGTVYVDGNAQDAAADTMNAGLLAVKGSAGDALAYGMRGGRVYVLGDAGYRAGVHMKAYEEHRSILVIGGRAGSFLGEYLAGGIIIVLGMGYEGRSITGYFCGNGMYAGTIYLRTERIPPNLSDKLIRRNVEEEEKEGQAIKRPAATRRLQRVVKAAQARLEQEGLAYTEHRHNEYIMRMGYLLNGICLQRKIDRPSADQKDS